MADARIYSLRGQGNNGPPERSRPPNYDKRVPSSFGAENTTTPQNLPRNIGANQIWESDRFKMLEFRQGYYECTQHDAKVHDFQGRAINSGGPIAGTQPLLNTAVLPDYIPLDQRRPSNPYRIGRMVVSQFTSFLFGEDTAPTPGSTDPETDAAVKELARVQSLVERMLHARNMGGASGSVGLSWRFIDGVPRVTVHPGKRIHIDEWEDEEEGIPSYVVELYQTSHSVWDPIQRRRVDVLFWVRRDWTPNEDIEYEDAQVTEDEPVWVVKDTYEHGDGECHFVWVRNTDTDTSDVDGDPDYSDTYEQQNQLDTLNSIGCTGTIRNLDPTLVLKRDTMVGDGIIKKGSGNGLDVGPNGDAKYLELTGASVAAGKVEFDKQRAQVLEVCQCVIPDPDVVATAGTSGTALKLLYAPTLSRCDQFRVKYGRAMTRLLDQQLRSWRNLPTREYQQAVVDPETNEQAVDENGEPKNEKVDLVVSLQPRVVEEPKRDEAGNLTQEVEVKHVPHTPGNGVVELTWPPYFPPSPEDDQKFGSALSAAVGSKAVLSQKTAVDKMAHRLGVDPEVEWEQVIADQERARREQSEIFPGFGGAVDTPDELPPGATERVEDVPEVDGEPVDAPVGVTKPDPLAVSQESALNGAQVTSLIEVLDKIATKQFPRAVGVQVIVAAFPLNEAQAEKMVGELGKSFVPAESGSPEGGAPNP